LEEVGAGGKGGEFFAQSKTRPKDYNIMQWKKAKLKRNFGGGKWVKRKNCATPL